MIENPEQVAESTDQAEPLPAAGAKRAEFKGTSKPVDFRRPVLLSSANWRKIRLHVEEYVETLGALLSTYLRLDFGLQLAKVDTAKFDDLAGALPTPTHLTLFRLEPWRGISFLEIRPEIGLCIIDRLLGGPGKPATLDRTFTEMEVALMDQLVQLVLNEWCKHWSRFQPMRADIAGHESNPKFLQGSSADAVMLVFTMDARMSESVGRMQLAVPYHAIESLLVKLTESESSSGTPSPLAPTIAWNRNLEALPLTATAEWAAVKLPAREFLRLKVGDVMELQPKAAESVELRFNKLTKFKGRLGTRENKWAVQITEISKL